MRQILIIDKTFNKYEELRKQLEEKLTVEIITANEVENAISLLHILPELDLILFSATEMGVAKLLKVENFLSQEKLQITLFGRL